MKKKLKVYIASPYTNGNKRENVVRQIDAAKILLENGFTPFIPLLSHFAEHHTCLGEKTWLDWDLEWLEVCDILVRIRAFDEDGNEIPSAGADLEEEKASKLLMPVYDFNSLEELKEWCILVKVLDIKDFSAKT